MLLTYTLQGIHQHLKIIVYIQHKGQTYTILYVLFLKIKLMTFSDK